MWLKDFWTTEDECQPISYDLKGYAEQKRNNDPSGSSNTVL